MRHSTSELATPPAVDHPPAASDRSYLGLASQVHALIASGEFSAGMRLPSERTLAERFSVSRTLVREAIIALEVQGLVEVRGGSGIYVCAQTPAPGPEPFELTWRPGPIETLRARVLIESEVAGLAASERKDSDLDRMFSALSLMREHMDDKQANEAADRQFHLCLAESTGNRVLLHMVTALWDSGRSDPLWGKIEDHFHTTGLRLASQEDHQRIFAAVMGRDGTAARAAMRTHLERVISEFTQAWR
ncbi:FadR/GntR family transcriptional regulator [Cupriavidus consociatus]|uniref:FadR/GntR family transcriptional regulator n=1 Tax=Cupriavidus consociatus TaxID=2821357 RepID=UPI001AE50C7F|nr:MULTISPECIES: FadR/GntR family transcriptional regulator [unclassified Cupriavidus]MBP0619201.1 FadR family transcriptional regulator [Cupriavidus sp. LEh25]MDK2655847.1 FadR/GntR family transcriptional regulator [Cupriavidus sp. LEh21]